MRHPTTPRRLHGPLLTLLMVLLAINDPVRASDSGTSLEPEPQDDPRQAVPISVTDGTPLEIGERTGTAEAEQIRSMMRLTTVRSLPARLFHPNRTAALIEALPADYRDEIVALARASGVREQTLLAANVLVDTQCSALVNPAAPDAPLRVARNLDFFPASVIGSRTVVRVLRPTGKHAFIALGWPGFAGVTSGMNDAGITACVLLNRDRINRDGVPICFRIREILERCSNLDQAVACFESSPVASSHYILLADSHGSAVVWMDAQGLHRDDPSHGWLAVSNGAREHGLPLDTRGRRLVAVAERLTQGTVDDAVMRQSLSASYLDVLNAQAMVFVPAHLTLEFALGTAFHPAALSNWMRLDAGALLRGASAASMTFTDLGAVCSLPHPMTLR